MKAYGLSEIGCMIHQMFCAKPCYRLITPECLKKRTFRVGYDNGLTPGASVNDCGDRPGLIRYQWEFEVLGWMVNGSEIGQGAFFGPFEGWAPP